MQKRSVVILAVLLALSFIGGAVTNTIHRKRMAASYGALEGRGTLLADSGQTPSIDLRPAETLYTVLRQLREVYVEPIKSPEESKMARGAVKHMVSSLNDPNCRFLEPDERKVLDDSQKAVFHGIGASTALRRVKVDGLEEEHLIVLSTFPNSPARAAGVEPGDDIVAIDGRSVLPFHPYAKAGQMVDKARKEKRDTTTLRKELEEEQQRIDKGIPIGEAQGMLSSYNEKPIELTLMRTGADEPIKISVKPGRVVVEPVECTAPDGDKLAVVRVNVLVDDTAEALSKALDTCRRTDARGIVLDLRGVTGGSRSAAQGVAGLFISGKRIGTLKMSRNRFETIRADAYPADRAWKQPVVVLVDGGTGRFAELIAQALRLENGYKLVGENTSGDTVYSTVVDLVDGSAYILTTGSMVPISGIDYTDKGLAVDVPCVKGKNGDGQLAQALKTLGQSVSGS